MPFPVAGVHENVSLQLNGGPLGGTASIPATHDRDAWVHADRDVRQGASAPSRWRWSLGLSAEAGAVFGNPGPFFVSQSFSLGGVQYGKPLRGYEEFSITPRGYLPNADQFQAQRSRSAMRSIRATAELGIRMNQQLYFDAFYDAGNLWERPRDFDPTRLFRGAGFGASLVTPLGPLGVDLGYGFDRTNALGQPAPSGRCTSSSVRSSKSEFPMRSIVRATLIALVLTVGARRGRPQRRRPMKIAYVNTSALMEAAPGRDSATAILTREGNAFEAQLQKLRDSRQRDADEVPEGRADDDAAAKDKERRRSRRSSRSSRPRTRSSSSSTTQRKQEVLAPITDMVKKVLDESARRRRLLDDPHERSGQTPIVSADKNLDITDKAISRLRATKAPVIPAAKGGAPAAPAGVTKPRPPTR